MVIRTILRESIWMQLDSFLNEEFSNKELKYIESKNIDLDQWIMEITEEFTCDLL